MSVTYTDNIVYAPRESSVTTAIVAGKAATYRAGAVDGGGVYGSLLAAVNAARAAAPGGKVYLDPAGGDLVADDAYDVTEVEIVGVGVDLVPPTLTVAEGASFVADDGEVVFRRVAVVWTGTTPPISDDTPFGVARVQLLDGASVTSTAGGAAGFIRSSGGGAYVDLRDGSALRGSSGHPALAVTVSGTAVLKLFDGSTLDADTVTGGVPFAIGIETYAAGQVSTQQAGTDTIIWKGDQASFVFESSPAGVLIPPSAKFVRIRGLGGGAKGGGGATGAASVAGGGGGGGGAYNDAEFPIGALGAGSFLSVTVGAGGTTGGVGGTGTNSVGTDGQAGGDSYVSVTGGPLDGQTIWLAQGGAAGKGSNGTSSASAAGGVKGLVSGGTGGSAANNANGSAGTPTATGVAASGTSQGGGGGAGGAATAAFAFFGGAGGACANRWNLSSQTALGGNPAGDDGDDGAGFPGAACAGPYGGGGGGGGASSITGNAGKGGAGHRYGGGGGGGGGALNGHSAGDSGAGAPGVVEVSFR